MNAIAAATIRVNGRPQPLAAGATVFSLMRELGFVERKGVAVAVNGDVVSRSEWTERPLAADDSVLVIQATQGG
jgi:sulfur carrier protein